MNNNGTQNTNHAGIAIVIARYRVAMRTAKLVYPFRSQAGCGLCDSVNFVAPGFGCTDHRNV